MSGFMRLVKRNMDMYLRNRSNVMFSMLSAIIILVLNTVFLGDINEGYLTDFVTLENSQSSYLTGSWLMAGIIIVNVVMVTLATIGIMVEDEEEHKLAAFLVSPVKRGTLTLSYIVAACNNAFILSLVTLFFSQIYLYITCQKLLSFMTILKLLVVIIAVIFSMVTLFICIATVVHSMSTFSALTTTIGTLIGFVAGIYLPMGSLSENIQNILKLFPVLYGTALARQVYTEEAITGAFEGIPIEFVTEYKKFMGITIHWGENEVSVLLSLLLLIGSGIIFTIIAIILLNHKQASDR